MGYFSDLRIRQMRKIIKSEKQVLRDSMVLLKLKYLAKEITEVEYAKEAQKFRDAYATILSVEVYLDKHGVGRFRWLLIREYYILLYEKIIFILKERFICYLKE